MSLVEKLRKQVILLILTETLIYTLIFVLHGHYYKVLGLNQIKRLDIDCVHNI